MGGSCGVAKGGGLCESMGMRGKVKLCKYSRWGRPGG